MTRVRMSLATIIAGFAAINLCAQAPSGASGAKSGSGRQFQPGHGPGVIMGTVNDASGVPVDGAVVAAVSLPMSTLPGPFTALTFTTPTFGGGKFSIIGIPSGRYQLCVEHQAQAVVNPCVWADNPVTVIVGTTLAKPQLIVDRGAFITIRLDDPKGLIAKQGVPNDVLIGAGLPTRPFIAARPISSDAGGVTYRMLVPAGKAMSLTAFSANYQLKDDSGNAISATSGAITLPPQAAQAVTSGAGNATLASGSSSASPSQPGNTPATQSASAPAVTIHVSAVAAKGGSSK